MRINTFKFISSLLIFSLNLFSSFLPCYFNSQSWVSYAESLAGGVFWGAFAIHLFPEAIHSFSSITHIPVGPIIALLFFLILLIIDIFASSHSHSHEHLSHKEYPQNHSHSSMNDQNDALYVNREENQLFEHCSSEMNENTNTDSKVLLSSNESRFAVENGVHKLDEFRSYNISTVKNRYSVDSSTLVVYFVLIFHCIIEAFGFGLLKSRSLLIALLCAIIGHKPVETFSIGILLLQSLTKSTGNVTKSLSAPQTNTSNENKATHFSKPNDNFSLVLKNNTLLMKKYSLMMIAFSATTPLTIIFSMYFGGGFSSPLFFGIIASASSGVFMFVGFHEITEILHESNCWDKRKKILHMIWFAIGLIWMSLIGLFSEEHEH